MRNKQFFGALSVALVLVSILSVNLAFAQVTIPQATGQPALAFGASGNSFRVIVQQILNLALQVAGYIAIAFVLYGGFRYMTAGGNEDAAESGKKILFNAIIGLAIIILAYVILQVVQNAVTGTI